jgi:hypothetical protein
MKHDQQNINFAKVMVDDFSWHTPVSLVGMSTLYFFAN